MNINQRIGLGFLLLGLTMILLFYFIASKEAFVIAALAGLMAMAFGGFQLLIAKPSSKNLVKSHARKGKAQKHAHKKYPGK